MNSKEFKSIFHEIAKQNNFEKAFGGWFKESPECIVVLDLQKSNYGDYYEMNVKVFIQSIFGRHYIKNKDLVKKDIGNIFTRQPKELRDVLVFDEVQMTDEERLEKTKQLFNKFVVPFAEKALSISGIKQLRKEGIVFIPPAVEEEIVRLHMSNISN